MADFPAIPAPLQISSLSNLYSGMSASSLHATSGATSAPASANWPSANRGIFVPVFIPAGFNLQSFFVLNGASAAGNIDMGLYGIDGTLIVSKGSTAASGTNVLQILTVTSQIISGGYYYIALACSSASHTVFAKGASVLCAQRSGVIQAASQVPLATAPTLATPASAFEPLFGISQLTTY